MKDPPLAVEALLAILLDEGVRLIFGNPGSTELSLMDALVDHPELSYMLALQEASAVGMADGYAQATGRPAFVNLHTAAGLGNGMGAITNTLLTQTPLVITAGQQDTRHLFREPWLSGDLVGIARGAVKWAYEVRAVDDLGPALRRAFATANAPPKGPVFLSLPMNLLREPVTTGIPARSAPPAPASGDVTELLARLVEHDPDRLALLLSDEVSTSSAVEEAIALAEVGGYRVYGTPLLGTNVFPSRHPAWRGVLKPDCASIRAELEAYDAVVLVGGHALFAYPYQPGAPLPERTRLYQLSADRSWLGREVPATIALWGDARATLGRLAHDLGPLFGPESRRADRNGRLALERRRLDASREERLAALEGRRPMPPELLAKLIADALPADAVIVNEAPFLATHLREHVRTEKGSTYFFARGGGLGWGLPGAVGISLAHRPTPVICVMEDGAMMYSPQALWSAAHERVPLTVIVANNARYEILMNVARDLDFPNARAGRFVGMSIEQPSVDFGALAQSCGLPYRRAEDPPTFLAAFCEALASGQPSLLEVPIS
jgi:benzoylformate decarboxylase